jgi:hypothetical protein
MPGSVKHFSLNRICGTELRVISDVETEVLPVVQVEETVIRSYAHSERWPHRWVTLFILQNLEPLMRQLRARSGAPHPSSFGGALPPGGVAALKFRPVINVYDLADLGSCHVYVNRAAMVKEGYWNDLPAIEALLAHEHAHPLVEGETNRASRRLQVQVSRDSAQSTATSTSALTSELALNSPDRVCRLLALLAEKLCVYAPREVLANELTISSGFGDCLLYVDQGNVANASRSLAGRADLQGQLRSQVAQGKLTVAEADLLLLIGDLRGYLELALEIAPFYCTGRDSDARGLEETLQTQVFPRLKPQVALAYAALRDQYVALRADLTLPELAAWSRAVLRILADALAGSGPAIQFRVVEG